MIRRDNFCTQISAMWTVSLHLINKLKLGSLRNALPIMSGFGEDFLRLGQIFLITPRTKFEIKLCTSFWKAVSYVK